jgi:hypothetical protein
MLRHLGAGKQVMERARLGVAFLGDGRRAAEAMLKVSGSRLMRWQRGWA